MKSAPCERPAPGEKIRRWVPEVPFWRPSKSIKTLRMFIHVRTISMISATYGMRVTFCISSVAIFISRAARIIDYCHDSYEGYTMSRQSFEIHRSAAATLAQGNGGFLSLFFFNAGVPRLCSLVSPAALTGVAVKSLELRRDQEAKSGCVLGGVFGRGGFFLHRFWSRWIFGGGFFAPF